MNILAVVAGVFELIGYIKQLYDAGKAVKDFFDNPDNTNRARYEDTMILIINSRQTILLGCNAILQAIAQLDQTIFHEHMADKLGDAEQAQHALDNFRRTGQVGQRDAALNVSAGALTDMLEYSRVGMYPKESIILPLSEILLIRLMILKEADPGFITPPSLSRKSIEDGVAFIRGTVESLRSSILAADVIYESEKAHVVVRNIPASEGGGRETIRYKVFSIRSANVISTKVYERSISSEDVTESEYEAAISHARYEARAVRAAGIADDYEHAGISTFIGIADEAQKCLSGEEMRLVSNLVYRRNLSLSERAKLLELRKSLGLGKSVIELIEFSPADEALLDDPATLRSYADSVLNRGLTSDEEMVLTSVAKIFGKGAAVRMLLTHPDCSLRDDCK